MPWSEAMQLGIESIDVQHRWLVDATNRLHATIQQSNGQPDRAVLGEILEGLVDYTMNHFVLEEELFQRFGYPETTEHKAEHDGFTAKAMELLLQFEDGADLGEEALELLKNWLQHHILKVDRAYVPFLLANGVS
jgi:hemerythrin